MQHRNEVLDAQQIELVGRCHLVASLAQGQVETADPTRVDDVDLIAWKWGGRWRPIQLKAAADRTWSWRRKYERFPDLLMAHVWGCAGDERRIFVLTVSDAHAVGDHMGYSSTLPWRDGRYDATRVDAELEAALLPFELRAPEDWSRWFS
jgi:hypothetical protein